MKLAVLSLTSPNSQVIGYAKRFMSEFATGLLVGSIGKGVASELVDVLIATASRGCLIVASGRHECGFEVLYFNLNERALCDFDGMPLVEVRVPKQSLE